MASGLMPQPQLNSRQRFFASVLHGYSGVAPTSPEVFAQARVRLAPRGLRPKQGNVFTLERTPFKDLVETFKLHSSVRGVQVVTTPGEKPGFIVHVDLNSRQAQKVFSNQALRATGLYLRMVGESRNPALTRIPKGLMLLEVVKPTETWQTLHKVYAQNPEAITLFLWHLKQRLK